MVEEGNGTCRCRSAIAVGVRLGYAVVGAFAELSF